MSWGGPFAITCMADTDGGPSQGMGQLGIKPSGAAGRHPLEDSPKRLSINLTMVMTDECVEFLPDEAPHIGLADIETGLGDHANRPLVS